MILSPVLLVALVASVFLVFDLKTQEYIQKRHPIGKLVRFTRRIRYKPRGAFAWQDAQIGQPIFKGDLIITGPQSTALVETDDHQKIQLQPGSSVIIDDLQDLRNVNGSVLIQKTNGDEKFLGDFLTMGTSGAFVSLPAHLIFPEALSDVFISDTSLGSRSLTFSWKLNLGQEPVALFLQLAKNHLFEGESLREFPIPAGALQIDLPVSEGVQYWRLVDSKRKPFCIYRQFNVRKVSPLQIEAPMGSVTSWDDSVDFQWSTPSETVAQLGSYWIEISADSTFTLLLQKKSVPGLAHRFTIRGLPSGKLFWRITSRYSNLTVSSAPQEIHVERGHQLSVTLQTPRKDGVAYAGTEVFFSWDSNSSKCKSIFEIESLSESGIPTKRVEVANSYFSISDLKPGRYRWRVLISLGKLRAESPWREISLFPAGGPWLLQPKAGETIEISPDGSPIKFEWSGTGADYLIEISGDPEFRKILAFKKSKTTKTTSAEFNLIPGHDYFWRVVLMDTKSVAVAISAPSSFKLSPYRGLSAPFNILPQSGVVCNPLKTKHPCVFSWSVVPGAAQYEVEFFRADSSGRAPLSAENEKPVLRQSISENSFQLKSLEDGLYFWRVRALDQKRRRGVGSELQSFRFTLGTRLSAPKIRNSEVQ